MKKLIIPRKDHEVYFISIPKNQKIRHMRLFALEQLEKMHPCFSSSLEMDLRKLVLNGERWIMATVMKADALAGYRILNKGTSFFTNTSISVHEREFTKNGISTIDDERIGFDAEINSPVSVPLKSCGDHVSKCPSAGLKNIPLRYCVFPRKLPFKIYILIIAATITVMSVFFAIRFTDGEKVSSEAYTADFPPADISTAVITEQKYLPGAIEALAGLSADIADAGGMITRWQYNEDVDPFLTIQIKGINVQTMHGIFGRYEFTSLADVQEVRYSDGEPYFSVQINAGRSDYNSVPAEVFPGQNNYIPIISGLSNTLQNQGISIISEALPSSGNGNANYTVTYTAFGRDLIRSLETLMDMCEKQPLRIKNMEVSIGGDRSVFTVICTLFYRGISITSQSGIETEKILPAFGYRDYRIFSELPIAGKTEIVSNQFIIGSIRDENTQRVFFRDTYGGKIKMRVGNE